MRKLVGICSRAGHDATPRAMVLLQNETSIDRLTVMSDATAEKRS